MSSLVKVHRRSLLLAAAAVGWPGAPSQAQPAATATATASTTAIAGLNEAVNQAGRQRMLSQRMAKAWLALGQQIEPDRSRRMLAESAALFERQLAALQAFAPTPKVRSTYAALGDAWGRYRQSLTGLAPAAGNTAALVALDSQVLGLAHQGTVALEALAPQPATRLVNLAGRQRMLSQRLAKYYLVQRWQAEVPDAGKQADIARAEFVTALTQLYEAPEATPLIREQLQLGQQQWVFFANALAQHDPRLATAQHALDVFKTSETLLQVMDRVTGLYTRLGAA